MEITKSKRGIYNGVAFRVAGVIPLSTAPAVSDAVATAAPAIPGASTALTTVQKTPVTVSPSASVTPAAFLSTAAKTPAVLKPALSVAPSGQLIAQTAGSIPLGNVQSPTPNPQTPAVIAPQSPTPNAQSPTVASQTPAVPVTVGMKPTTFYQASTPLQITQAQSLQAAATAAGNSPATTAPNSDTPPGGSVVSIADNAGANAATPASLPVWVIPAVAILVIILILK